MQMTNLMCQSLYLFSKIAVQNVDWVSNLFCGRQKIIYGHNFVAPLIELNKLTIIQSNAFARCCKESRITYIFLILYLEQKGLMTINKHFEKIKH